MDFEIGRFTRKCAGTDRPLKPGEVFYSVLIPKGAEVIRVDYSAGSWPGPPDNAICFWKSEMPDVAVGKVTWAPKDAILGYFEERYEQGGEGDQLYVLALLLIRKRFVRLEETEHAEDESDVMLLYCPSNEKEYRVPVVDPTPERSQAIQQELEQLLFSAIK